MVVIASFIVFANGSNKVYVSTGPDWYIMFGIDTTHYKFSNQIDITKCKFVATDFSFGKSFLCIIKKAILSVYLYTVNKEIDFLMDYYLENGDTTASTAVMSKNYRVSRETWISLFYTYIIIEPEHQRFDITSVIELENYKKYVTINGTLIISDDTNIFSSWNGIPIEEMK